MSRCKKIILTLSLIAGLGLSVGCSKEDAADKGAAEAAKTDATEAKADEKEGEEKAEADQLPVEATGPVAVVNGAEVTADDFNEAIKLTTSMMPGQAVTPQIAQMLKSNTLDRLIDMKLIDAALEKAKVEVSTEEIDAEMAKFKERLPNKEEYEKFLEQRGLTEAKMRENIGKDRQLRELLKKEYGGEATEKEAKEMYDKNKDRYSHGAQVHARHILLNVKKDADEATVADAKKRADAIAAEAKKPGADFEALAKEKSEGPTASRGGDLGYFEKSRMVPEFAEAAFAMKAGEISDPVRSDFGFHIIQVVDKKEAGTTSFDEAKEMLIAQLERQKFMDAMTKLLEDLKKDAKIEKKEDNIKINATAPEGGAPVGMDPQQQLQQQIQEQIKKQQQQKEGAGGEAGELKLKEPSLGK
ncbi:peptidylprolyl isomerase [Bradymonas sediminis]|uniref:Uncharacterized protein n=1 Tax=Bradymonas sediminis TaxID=1548548 RepID=A0A2Z4FK30_9DELT|nr:peptidylprolyl isomerase [Bradymonas sediminis]AWV89303.1 hypothetical protein DN745_08115 [Bradymonas sediminis]TDP73477.1 peptidyl-prolyl cis-trans isomerase C [Bradymonas sediminis]